MLQNATRHHVTGEPGQAAGEEIGACPHPAHEVAGSAPNPPATVTQLKLEATCRARKLDHHQRLEQGRGEDAVFTPGRLF
jgi:hypothetical protein